MQVGPAFSAAAANRECFRTLDEGAALACFAEQALRALERAPGCAKTVELSLRNPEVVENDRLQRRLSLRFGKLQRDLELVSRAAEGHPPQLKVPEARSQDDFHPLLEASLPFKAPQPFEPSNAGIFRCVIAGLVSAELGQLGIYEDEVFAVSVRVGHPPRLFKDRKGPFGKASPVAMNAEETQDPNPLPLGELPQRCVERLEEGDAFRMVASFLEDFTRGLRQLKPTGETAFLASGLVQNIERVLEMSFFLQGLGGLEGQGLLRPQSEPIDVKPTYKNLMKLDSVIPFGRSFDEYSLMFALTEQDWEFFHDVASTQTILRELSDLLDFLSGVPAAKADDGSNPVEDVRWYAEELQKICALSIQHGLPVIFHG